MIRVPSGELRESEVEDDYKLAPCGQVVIGRVAWLIKANIVLVASLNTRQLPVLLAAVYGGDD